MYPFFVNENYQPYSWADAPYYDEVFMKNGSTGHYLSTPYVTTTSNSAIDYLQFAYDDYN